MVKWNFWKKDDLALPDLKGMDLGLPKEGASGAGLDFSTSFQAPPSMPPMPSMQPPSFSQQYPMQAPSMSNGFPGQGYSPQQSGPEENSNTHIQKDLEVIAAKLDTIRAQLDMLNARLANLERTGEGPKRPWY